MNDAGSSVSEADSKAAEAAAAWASSRMVRYSGMLRSPAIINSYSKVVGKSALRRIGMVRCRKTFRVPTQPLAGTRLVIQMPTLLPCLDKKQLALVQRIREDVVHSAYDIIDARQN